MEEPICQVCQARKATVSYSSRRSGHFLGRTYVCIECAPTFERLFYDCPGGLGNLVANAAIASAKAAGIDPTTGCPGCGMTLAQVLTDAAVGCEICYEHFSSDLDIAIETIQGWKTHVGKISYRL